MTRIDKHAGFYRGYLTDDRSFVPVTIVLGITVGLWLLVYLVGAVGHPYQAPVRGSQHASSPLLQETHEAARRP